MKNKKIIRKFTVLLAALVIMCGFSVTAYAGGGDESDDTPTPVTEETPAPETEPEEMEMSRNVQSGNTQNLKSMVIQRSFPKWSVAERRKTAAASDQAAVCACTHSRYFAGGSPIGLRV